MPLETLQENATLVSAFCTSAYNVLASDVSRAQYLLKTEHGIEALAEGEREKDMDLMVWVFETREEIEDADDETELSALLMQVQSDHKEMLNSISKCFEDGKYEEVKKHLEKTRYLE